MASERLAALRCRSETSEQLTAEWWVRTSVRGGSISLTWCWHGRKDQDHRGGGCWVTAVGNTRHGSNLLLFMPILWESWQFWLEMLPSSVNKSSGKKLRCGNDVWKPVIFWWRLQFLVNVLICKSVACVWLKEHVYKSATKQADDVSNTSSPSTYFFPPPSSLQVNSNHNTWKKSKANPFEAKGKYLFAFAGVVLHVCAFWVGNE